MLILLRRRLFTFLHFSSCFSIQGIGGGASRNLMEQYAEVLFSLNKNCFTLLVVWLKEALQPPGFPSSRITDAQKANFSSQILRSACVFCSFLLCYVWRWYFFKVDIARLPHQLLRRAESGSTSDGWRRSWRSLRYCAEGSMAQSMLPSTKHGEPSLQRATVKTPQNQTITCSRAAPSMKTPWSDCNLEPARPGHTREPARRTEGQIVNPMRL